MKKQEFLHKFLQHAWATVTRENKLMSSPCRKFTKTQDPYHKFITRAMMSVSNNGVAIGGHKGSMGPS